MPNTRTISDNEVHTLGINIVLDDIRKNGFTVLSTDTNSGTIPQIIARRKGQHFIILVRTAVYPKKGKLENRETALKNIQDAQKQGAMCFFASVSITSGLGATDLGNSRATKGTGFTITYDELEERMINQVVAEDARIEPNPANANPPGATTGTATRVPDHGATIFASDKSENGTILKSMCNIFAENMDAEQRLTFSRWAHLPTSNWSESHREAFAQALIHFFVEIEGKGGHLPASVSNALESFPPQDLAPLQYPLTFEVREIFSYFIGG
jgi:hypothetical protein